MGLDAAAAAALGAWTVQSEGSGGSYLDGWEGGTERCGSSAAGCDVEHKHPPPQSKTKEKISPAISEQSQMLKQLKSFYFLCFCTLKVCL